MVCAAQGQANNSTFSTGLGIWKGNRRSELWHEKVFPSNTWITEGSKKGAQEWGFLNKAAAIERYRYKSITGRDVSSLGLAIHPGKRLDWIRASPDGLLGWFPGGGVLECPFNEGKPETMPSMENYSILLHASDTRSNGGYWELILHGLCKSFLLLGREEEAKSLKPTSTHKLTGLVIVDGLNMAGES